VGRAIQGRRRQSQDGEGEVEGEEKEVEVQYLRVVIEIVSCVRVRYDTTYYKVKR